MGGTLLPLSSLLGFVEESPTHDELLYAEEVEATLEIESLEPLFFRRVDGPECAYAYPLLLAIQLCRVEVTTGPST